MSTEAEAILAEPASPPKPINGACTFSNAKDSLYMVWQLRRKINRPKAFCKGKPCCWGSRAVNWMRPA